MLFHSCNTPLTGYWLAPALDPIQGQYDGIFLYSYDYHICPVIYLYIQEIPSQQAHQQSGDAEETEKTHAISYGGEKYR